MGTRFSSWPALCGGYSIEFYLAPATELDLASLTTARKLELAQRPGAYLARPMVPALAHQW